MKKGHKAITESQLKRAAAGETIYIGAYGKPEVAIISADKVLPKKPVSEAFGCMRGKIKFYKGWDDPLPDDILGDCD